MKICFYKMAFVILCVLGYVILCSSYVPLNISHAWDVSGDTIVEDTLTRLDILKSKKWVKILDNKMEDGIFLFSDRGFDFVAYWDGKPARVMKSVFYLSDTADKVFDRKKIGASDGKYLVIETNFYLDTYDNTEVYEILILTTKMLKINLVRLHNEVIAGGTPLMTFEGREKDKIENN